MDKLHLGIEIRDFDLERMGFSLSVLDQIGKRQTSEAYLRMTLSELNAFLKALKSAEGELDLSTLEPAAVKKLPSAPTLSTATESDPSTAGTPPIRRR
jgi:hypothetical protein